MIEFNKQERILIVDDSEDFLKMTKLMLEQGGFEKVDIVTSAEAALKKCGIDQDGAIIDEDEMPYDLALIDIVMPGMDGLELSARLRMQPHCRHMPILIITADHDLNTLNQAYMAGADDFVVKPIDKLRLHARVRTLLRMRREQRRRELREADLKLQNLNLKQGRLEGVMVDPICGLPRQSVAELILNSCREKDSSATIGLFEIVDFENYRERHGSKDADILYKNISSILSDIPAPLSSILCAYGLGRFIVIQPATEDSTAIEKLSELVKKEVSRRKIKHGNSSHNRNVLLWSNTKWSDSNELFNVLDDLINSTNSQLLE